MTTVNVVGTTTPWNFSGGINASFDFGIHNGTAPIVPVKNLKDGQTIFISYLSGTVRASASRLFYNCIGDTTFVANGNLGSTGTFFPSKYMPSSYGIPVYLIALVGCWATSTGQVVGTPFYIGNGGGQFTVPAGIGATQLQIGANDDDFSDNSGTWVVNVVAAEFPAWTNPRFARTFDTGFPSGAGNVTGSGQIFPTGSSF